MVSQRKTHAYFGPRCEGGQGFFQWASWLKMEGGKRRERTMWLDGLIWRYMLSTWPVANSPKNCWHKSVWPHANTVGCAARHTLVLKEECKALIRPSLLGLSPETVVDTSPSEVVDIYEQGGAAAIPMDGPGIWHKPTGRAYSARTGRGTWELTKETSAWEASHPVATVMPFEPWKCTLSPTDVCSTYSASLRSYPTVPSQLHMSALCHRSSHSQDRNGGASPAQLDGFSHHLSGCLMLSPEPSAVGAQGQMTN